VPRYLYRKIAEYGLKACTAVDASRRRFFLVRTAAACGEFAGHRHLARERAAVILMVRSGKLTATEGAERLGISRKTYYEWEDRALKAMAEALENQAPGRPPSPFDPEKEELQREVVDLKKKLLLAEQTIEVKDLLTAYDLHEAKKNQKKREKNGKNR